MSTPANIGQVLRAAQKAVAAQTANRDAAVAAAASAPLTVPPAAVQAPPAAGGKAAGNE